MESEQQKLKLQSQARRENLIQASATFGDLKRELQAKTKDGELPRIDAIILRRALFGLAEAHRDLGELREAVETLEALLRDHPRTVEAFYARLGLVSVYNRIDDADGKFKGKVLSVARHGIMSLRTELEGLADSDPVFAAPALSRREWLTWIDDQLKGLQPPPLRAGS